MKLKNIALLLLSVVTFTVSAQAQKDKEIIKTGYNFGPLPAVAVLTVLVVEKVSKIHVLVFYIYATLACQIV